MNYDFQGFINFLVTNNMKLYFQSAKPVLAHFTRLAYQRQAPITQCVAQFESCIMENSILRMNMEIGIICSQETLKGNSISEVIRLIDAGINEPPSFSTYPLLGAHLNSIFCEFMQTQNGRNFFSNPTVNIHIKKILDHYALMLKSPKSLKYLNDSEPQGWFNQSARKFINYNEVQCQQSKPFFGFSSWNDLFIRKLKPQTREIYGEGTLYESKCIINACQHYPLQNPRMPVNNIKLIDDFWLKNNKYSLVDMFGPKHPKNLTYSKFFEGGLLYQGFLSVFCYHRWHSPIDGIILDDYLIEGTYFLDRSQFIQKDLDSQFYSQGFLSSVATRRIIIIKADNQEIGYVGLIFIGIADISSCISQVKQGVKVKKGQELGRFEIGGSSMVMLFSKNSRLKFKSDLYDQNVGRLQKVNSLLAQLE